MGRIWPIGCGVDALGLNCNRLLIKCVARRIRDNKVNFLNNTLHLKHSFSFRLIHSWFNESQRKKKIWWAEIRGSWWPGSWTTLTSPNSTRTLFHYRFRTNCWILYKCVAKRSEKFRRDFKCTGKNLGSDKYLYCTKSLKILINILDFSLWWKDKFLSSADRTLIYFHLGSPVCSHSSNYSSLFPLSNFVIRRHVYFYAFLRNIS